MGATWLASWMLRPTDLFVNVTGPVNANGAVAFSSSWTSNGAVASASVSCLC
jgi:hypothetical protein